MQKYGEGGLLLCHMHMTIPRTIPGLSNWQGEDRKV